MRHRFTIVLLALAVVAAACGDDDAATSSSSTTIPSGTPTEVTLRFDFETGSEGWRSDIADYTAPTRPEDFVSETGATPPTLEDEGSDFFRLAASNTSDDLFMFIRRPVGPADGLVPEASYEIEFTVRVASNAPTGCAGIGGAPGESVWLKVGAATSEPIPVREGDETRLSVDKGGQSEGGVAANVAGTIANGIPCEEALDQDPQPYALITLAEEFGGPVTAGDDGRLWLFVGTDSGFEGRTDLYYDRIEVVLRPIG